MDTDTRYRALFTAFDDAVIGILETTGPNALEMLRKQITREWMPIFGDGDSIRIVVLDEDE